MFISDEYKLIVMLPQKCASATLQKRLESIRSPESLDTEARYDEELGKFAGKHITFKNAYKLQAFKSRLDYSRVCFVRNPYDRVYSWFMWIQKTAENPVKDEASVVKEGPERFAHMKRVHAKKLKKLEEADYDFNRYLKRNKKRFKPACRFTHHKGRCHVDFVGFQESFEMDYEEMAKRFGLPVSDSGNRNVISGRRCDKRPSEMTAADYQYTHLFNRESIRTVNRLFRKDFKYFGYPVLDPKSFPRSLD